ncbi:MAG TPA: energy transducer TonB, partial [Aeromonadales bacterium]|nr:energy transducer TonB [Aeromonadales bacterium]
EYGKLLRRKIREHQSYPLKKMLRVRRYRKLMEKGPMKSEGILWVKIARDGSVLSTRMEESTKISILDKAAIQMVEKADPLPPMPKLLVGNDFEFLIKVAFLSPKLN